MKTRANGDCSKTSELSNVGMTTCKPQPISAADAVPRRSTFGTPEPVMTNHAQAGSAQIDLSSPVAILSERSSGCAVSGQSQHTRLHVLNYLRVDLPSARNNKTRRFRFLNKPRGVHLLMVLSSDEEPSAVSAVWLECPLLSRVVV